MDEPDRTRSANRPAPYRKEHVEPEPGFEGVEVWSADLDQMTEPLDACLLMLDPAEVARAASFHFPLHADRFIRRRWLRRRILADRFGVDPREVRFATESLGRDLPVAPAPLAGIGFSASHADGRALVAIRPSGDVGVDIARLDPALGDREARVFMSPSERARWSMVAGDEALRSLFRFWTRKEACLKCAGTGLARDPRTVESGDPRVTAPAHGVWPAAAWHTLAIDMGRGWAAAVAIPA